MLKNAIIINKFYSPRLIAWFVNKKNRNKIKLYDF